MSTDSGADSIPTLTDIIKPGDASMKNHFDPRYFDEDDRQITPDETGAEDELIEIIEVQVQEALNESLPALEERLKGELTRRVLEKLRGSPSTPADR